MFERKQIIILESRILGKKNLIQVLTGPRQSGKTTLATQLTKRIKIPYLFVSADSIPTSNAVWISQQWETARLQLRHSKAKAYLLIIDEIQKLTHWSEFVKKEWDKDRRNNINIRVLLLGSSTLLIDKGLTESLTGRFEMIKIPHWCYREMNEAFGFTPEEYVFFGGYPGAAELIGDEMRWKDYIRQSIIETTISKDILQLTTIQKPALLKNLFEIACFYNGEILSYNKLLGQLTDAGNTTTLAHYQDLLNQVWFISGLQKYSGSRIQTRSSTPKWMAYNTALSSVYEGTNFNDIQNDLVRWGRKIEQSIGAHLLNHSRVENKQLYYWREGNEEVDFVFKSGKKLVAIEVKMGKARIHTGLLSFDKKYKNSKTFLISDDTFKWQEFLELDPNELFD